MTSSIFADSWLAELLKTPENQTLSKALQNTLASNSTIIPTTLSSLSSQSDQENTQNNTSPKRQQEKHNILAPTRKLTKRKTRASKKTHTTYITADPANFREMVQQVTGGVRFNGATTHMQQLHERNQSVVKPEPQRPRFHHHAASACLPTLDTSAFLLNHVGAGGGGSGGVMGFEAAGMVTEGGGGAAVMEVGVGVDGFGGFPTLESSFARVVESGFVTF